MTQINSKLNIQSALATFKSGSLSQNAIALFDALGYNTTRQQPFEQTTYAFFKEYYVSDNNNFNAETAKVAQWQSIDLLFQVSKDEVSDQHTVFGTHQVEQTIIESYLFFALELKPAAYSRTELAQITREINKVFSMPAMILFKHGDSITLSIINRRLHKKSAQKDVLEKVTLIKDIATEKPHRAHIDILFDLSFTEIKRVHKVSNFVELHNAWQKILDTKELNKKFYKELSNWYFWAIKKVYFPSKTAEEQDGGIFAQDDKVQEHNAKNLIRLLTRILFVWFIKEKDLIPDELFDETYIREHLITDFSPKNDENLSTQKQHSKYYRAILQNLFFATLNQTAGKREFRKDKQHRNVSNLMRYESYFKDPQAFLRLVEDKVPFMNGGLFECLDKPDPHLKGKQGGDVILYEDGFSDRLDNPLRVPDYIFFDGDQHANLSDELGDKKQKDVPVKGLINILKAYKFTVTENTPIEEDIALDPELLGQVFENLLASYNPETKTTARKQTGSFYTPRHIVDYMVDESLIAYFSSHLEHNIQPDGDQRAMPVEPATGEARCTPDKLRSLLSYNDLPNPFSETETTQLINTIDNCKILDPACGSGAFPMGILHKLVHILHKLDPQNQRWQERQLEKARQIEDVTIRDQLIEDIEAAFTNNELDYGRKLYLIENCIYGVDIQPIATQISKLRFFISLIVDQKSDRNKGNFGIRPLPNLETKFVAANTLIGIDKPKTGINADSTRSLFDNTEIEALENQLKEVRHRLFSAKTPKYKRELRAKDEALREQIGALLEAHGWGNATAQQLANWNPYDQNASADFFDNEWMFGISDGFDVVIGNPPYIDSETMVKIGLASLRDYLSNKLKYTKGNWDIYIAFFETGFNLLNKLGVMSFITPDKWISKPFGYELRKGLLNNFYIITESGRNIFESANVDSIITFINKKQINYFDVYKFQKNESIKIASIPKVQLAEPYAFDWFFSKHIEIINKLEKLPRRLSEICICENACATSDAYKLKEFLFNIEQDGFDQEQHFKVINTGTIGRYISKWGVKPMTYLKDKYLTPVVNKSEFLNAFNNSYGIKSNKSKIIIKGLTLLDACIDEIGVIIPGKTTLILTETNQELSKLKFLLALLNSKLPLFYIKEKYNGSSYNGGINFNVDMINNLPIPNILGQTQQPFIKLIDYILYIISQPFYTSTDLAYAEERLMVNFLENLIDALVYELYFPDELHEAGKYFISLIEKENLPDLNVVQGDKISTLKHIIKRLTDKNHPLYVNLFFLDSVPVVRVIEGKP